MGEEWRETFNSLIFQMISTVVTYFLITVQFMNFDDQKMFLEAIDPKRN